jgi:hypothetical protein
MLEIVPIKRPRRRPAMALATSHPAKVVGSGRTIQLLKGEDGLARED